MSTEALLGDILSTLREIRDVMKLGIQAQAAKPATTRAAAPATPGGGEVATDAELDSKYGDPEVRKDPPRWKGEVMLGKKFSETSPEYLDEVASFNDWKASRPREGDDPKWTAYAISDAKKARGWAARLRNGHRGAAPKPTSNEYSGGGGGDYGGGGQSDGYGSSMDDIPFASSEPGPRGL